MKITITVTTFNRSHCIQKCLDSVYHFFKLCDEQKIGYELILVDDCSSDTTVFKVSEILATWDVSLSCWVKVFVNTSNYGVTYSKNRCYEEASGDWVIFLDSDDFLLIENINDLINEITEQEGSETSIIFFPVRRSKDMLLGKIDHITYLKNFRHIPESLPVLRHYVKSPKIFEPITRGFEGLGYFAFIKKYGHLHISDKVVRHYDTTGNDRLSSKIKTSTHSKNMFLGYKLFIQRHFIDLIRSKTILFFVGMLSYHFISILVRK